MHKPHLMLLMRTRTKGKDQNITKNDHNKAHQSQTNNKWFSTIIRWKEKYSFKINRHLMLNDVTTILVSKISSLLISTGKQDLREEARLQIIPGTFWEQCVKTQGWIITLVMKHNFANGKKKEMTKIIIRNLSVWSPQGDTNGDRFLYANGGLLNHCQSEQLATINKLNEMRVRWWG